MSELKTIPNKKSYRDFLESIENPEIKEQSYLLVQIMKELTNAEPRMWGDSIIGFGTYHYVYKSGREGDWFRTGFSPRKQNLTLYLSYGFEKNSFLLKKLGKYKTGKACLYIKNLKDVDIEVVKELIKESLKFVDDHSEK